MGWIQGLPFHFYIQRVIQSIENMLGFIQYTVPETLAMDSGPKFLVLMWRYKFRVDYGRTVREKMDSR
jgi:hypothetical protein